MSDILDDLRAVQRLRGDTYSSYEVLGMVGRAADEIERLTAALQDEREQCAMVAATEPAPDGDMPVAFATTPVREVVNATVRATRKSIAARIRARAALEEKPYEQD